MLKPEAAKSKDARSGMGALQHRHFATIATILCRIDAPPAIVNACADQLRLTNPKFNRDRFINAVESV